MDWQVAVLQVLMAAQFGSQWTIVEMDSSNAQKRAAAEAAVEQVRDGMVVGLGTGSTADLALDALGRRVRDGLRIVGVPTSERTAARARALNIPLAATDGELHIDLDID